MAIFTFPDYFPYHGYGIIVKIFAGSFGTAIYPLLVVIYWFVIQLQCGKVESRCFLVFICQVTFWSACVFGFIGATSLAIGAASKQRGLLTFSMVVNAIAFFLFAIGILELGTWFEGMDTGLYGIVGHVVVEGFILWNYVITVGSIKQIESETPTLSDSEETQLIKKDP